MTAGTVTIEQRSLLEEGRRREDGGTDFQLQSRELRVGGKHGPVFLASSSVDPAPDMEVNLISLHRQSKLSG